MSHVVAIKTKLKSLEGIKKACERMGWIFKHGQKTYKWFGEWVGDTDIPEHHFSPEELQQLKALPMEERRQKLNNILGLCHHAIQVPGANYEIGIIQRGDEFIPVWDYWCTGGLRNVLPENGMGGFIQAYTIEAAKLQALLQGATVQEEVMTDGTIRLRLRS